VLAVFTRGIDVSKVWKIGRGISMGEGSRYRGIYSKLYNQLKTDTGD